MGKVLNDYKHRDSLELAMAESRFSSFMNVLHEHLNEAPFSESHDVICARQELIMVRYHIERCKIKNPK